MEGVALPPDVRPAVIEVNTVGSEAWNAVHRELRGVQCKKNQILCKAVILQLLFLQACSVKEHPVDAAALPAVESALLICIYLYGLSRMVVILIGTSNCTEYVRSCGNAMGARPFMMQKSERWHEFGDLHVRKKRTLSRVDTEPPPGPGLSRTRLPECRRSSFQVRGASVSGWRYS